MSALLTILGILAFAFGILASIGLHEFGHLIPAKAFGGKVTQWFVGFGPTLFSRRVGETEYGVKAVPLGGYVKIIGMLPPPPGQSADEAAGGGERLRQSNTGMFGQLIGDARSAEWELVGPEDRDRLFYRMAWWKKVVVMAGGPTVNLLIAFVLFWGLFGLYGQRTTEVDAGAPVLAGVSRCVIPYVEEGRACTADDPPSPAYDAGLRPGDTIVSFNGTAISSYEQLRTLIRGNADGAAVIGYERDGQLREGRTSTTVEARPVSGTDETLRQVGFLGIEPSSHEEVAYGGPLYTLDQMGTMTVDSVQALATLPVKVWGVAKAIVGVQERAVDSPISIVGGGRIAGEIASDDRITAADRVAGIAYILAGFNLFIGLFNFVPLLPLDGGHIASALWEAARRAWARAFRRPDPGYVDAAKLLPLAYVVASFLLVMGLVLIVGDLVVPVSLS